MAIRSIESSKVGWCLALMIAAGFSAPDAQAQSAPSVTLVDPVFTPPTDVEPNPCFEFGCYNGSVFDDDTLAATGAVYPGVYVFERHHHGPFALHSVIVNPELAVATDDRSFGAHLALSGDELLISGTAEDSSKVYVFQRRGDGWAFRQALPVASNTLLLVHDTALIGTGWDVSVFEKDRHGQFRLEAVLRPPAGSDGTFGATLGLDGNVALIGAPVAPGLSGAGAAYAFQRLFSRWILVQTFTPPLPGIDTGFASALAIDHERIAIGAPAAPSTLPDRPGVVQTYVRRGLQWRPAETIENPIPDDGFFRQFGSALDLQGARLLVSGTTSYPFAPFTPMNYLFDLNRSPHPIAALDAASARSVRLSRRSALLDETGFRFGTIPEIFDLPQSGN